MNMPTNNATTLKMKNSLVKYSRLAATAVLVLVITGSQQIAAFTPNDFACANQGDFGGTCFYEKGCSTGGASSAGATPSSSNGPTIVLDPGHAPGTDETVDPATKEPVFDYENEPEMKQVWQVAQRVKAQLENDGYNVLITKKSLNDSSTNLKKRAEVGNQANAALGVSLHTNPGASQIYYPAVGDYLVKTTGQHDVYTDQRLAYSDKQAATTMAKDLQQIEGQSWEAGTYSGFYGSISREQGGITMKGTMLVTQYFAKVPWVYVEQAQTSTGSIDSSTSRDYAKGVVKGIEDIMPPGSGSNSSSSGGCCPSGGGITVSGSISPQAGHGMSPSAQQKFQQYAVAAGQKNNVDPDLLVTFYYNEMGRTGDSSGNNADAAQPPPVAGDGKWIEPAPPIGTGRAYVTNDLGYAEPMGLDDYDKQTYGQDGDGDGRIVMTNLADALFTSAKYIAEHGGTGNNPSQAKVKAVGIAYNGAQYAESVVNTYNYLKSGGSGSVSGSTGSCSAASSSMPGTIEAAVQAAQQLSDMGISYVWGGSHGAGQIATTDPATLKTQGMDCSSSTSWVLHQAGMLDANARDSTGLESWGQAGQGSSMTVWANSSHVFIEFNVPGLGHYQMNTAGWGGSGPHFFKWGYPTSGFTPRHWPGT